MKDLCELGGRITGVGALRSRQEECAQQHQRQRHADEEVDRERPAAEKAAADLVPGDGESLAALHEMG